MRRFLPRGHAQARARSILFRLLAVFASAVAAGPAAAQAPEPVGRVNKVQNEANVVSATGAKAATIGTLVHMQDELRTGAGARLQVTFRDNTVLTLGEHARLTIDRYVYDPERGIGETALKAAAGAFRFVTGRMQNLKDKTIVVSTPVAQIGVRGTEFWGGPIDATYGVFLIAGEVTVTNQGGSVILSGAGQGADIPSAFDPPGPPSPWPADKVARAVESVALH
jgi:ferric-dicitrate binding protein FerR (iron transport regulator)